MDIMGKDERSERMRRVRSRGNRSTELKFRVALVRRGVRGWRMHDQTLPGCPDFVFKGQKLAIFIDGCFWHGCPVCDRPLPASNATYWSDKIRSNAAQARRVNRKLRALGFRVVRIWEHSLRSASEVAKMLDQTLTAGDV
jgi:DNA mismatch endonuclease, patch repair protein